MTVPTLRIKRLNESAHLPTYQTAGAAGMDLHAALEHPINIGRGVIVPVPLGRLR